MMTEFVEKKRRSALVTGSSRGIGRAIALGLAHEGYDVCVNYTSERSQDEADRLALLIEGEYGVRSVAIRADVSLAEEAKKLVDETREIFGGIDILVNNAGITRDAIMTRMKEEDFDDVIAVNLKGTFNCCKVAAAYMMKQRYGRIINMGSISGTKGNFGQANYAASKAGLVGFSKSIAKELASRNITVNVITPGFIETDMTDVLTDEQKQRAQDHIPLKRFGAAEEVAALACFLASDDASFITGQVIGIDGGMSL